MKQRQLAGKTVSEIGLGCMNLSHAYACQVSEQEARILLSRAFDLGVTHFDTAALYGFGSNEALVGKCIKPFRDKILLASKCGMTGVDGKRKIDGRPETLVKTLHNALNSLQTDYIDLYYLHRLDRDVPIEESVGALSQMVEQGKIGAIGLSEVSAQTLHKAHQVHPIAAMQTEYSLWTRNAEIAVLEKCRALDVAFVAFSPLARGFLSDTFSEPATLGEGDIRKGMPRFQGDNWLANRALLSEFILLAEEAGCTPAQLALKWVLSRGPDIHALPGTHSVPHLEQDMAASTLQVEDSVLQRADALINQRTVHGPRYPAGAQADIDTEDF